MQKDSFRSWIVIVLVGLALTISQMDRTLLAIAAPQMIAEQHVTGTAMGVLLSSFVWTYTVFQLPSGWLVDRFGAKGVLAIAFLFWSIACTATGFASSFAALVTCRLLLGVGEAPFYAAAHATMAKAFSERWRGLATAIYTKGASLGPAMGTMVGAWLLLGYGWKSMFVIVGVASLLFLIPWLLLVPSETNKSEASSESATTISWPTIKLLLKERAVWGVSVGYFGFLYLYYIYITWLPTYLAKSRGMNLKEIAWVASVPFLISLAAGPLAGFCADALIQKGYSKTAVRKGGIAVGLIMGSAIIPAAFATDITVAAAMFVIALAGQAVSAVNMLALPSAIAPKGHAGFVGALQQMLGSAGGIVSPIVTGVLLDQTHDFKFAIVCAGAMLCLAAISFLFILPRVEPIQWSNNAGAVDGLTVPNMPTA
jgi:MFS family permease